MKIFHHNDLDGYAAGAVAARQNGCTDSNDLFEVDYVMTLPIDKVGDGESVWFVDYSFKEDTRYVLDNLLERNCDVVWIDHHTSSIEFLQKYPEYKNIKGFVKEGISGAALCYMYCYDVDFDDIPQCIKYVSDFDCWQFKYGDTSTYFKLGMDSVDQNPLSSKWDELLSSNAYDAKSALDEILSRGKLINDFEEKQNTYYRDHFWYETTLTGFKDESLNGIKAAVINKRSNSKIFGQLYDEYPLVIAWVFNGERYIYSFFSHGGADCKKIAEELGGGGHTGAAGCSLDYLKFKK